MKVTLSGQDVDYWLESGEGVEMLVTAFENIVEDMKSTPGGDNTELQLVILNDFEPEEEDEEDDESEESATPSKEA